MLFWQMDHIPVEGCTSIHGLHKLDLMGEKGGTSRVDRVGDDLGGISGRVKIIKIYCMKFSKS